MWPTVSNHVQFFPFHRRDRLQLPRPQYTWLIQLCVRYVQRYPVSYLVSHSSCPLTAALAPIRESGLNFKLLLVGDGNVMNSLKNLVRQLRLDDVVIFTGRIPHEEVSRYYDLIDITVFPRKPLEVCELVSPIKPFEAMAQRKLVISSDTDALKEIVIDGETGFLFRKGSIESLSKAIERSMTLPKEQRNEIIQKAYLWVRSNRTWKQASKVCELAYDAARRIHLS